ncbi:MAG: selenium metabolism-associated LysR family transcriptional regulator [Bariatricus sp.]|nr:selenium metabolism-associated LysR family transcriptional regulator [Bariatricus sp.]
MRLEYVRSFIGVVNYKSFSLAAKYLYLSQPTISTHIKQLEAELGVQLLVRSTKDVLLSEEGKVFYPYALQLLETENQALRQLNRSENDASSTVRVAVSSVPGNYMFPYFMAHFRTKNTEICFRISEGDSGDVLQRILDYESEIGIGGLDSGSERIHSEMLFEDEIILITPNTAKYRKMNGRFPVEQLKKEWFITRELGSGTKNVSENIEQELKLNLTALHLAAQFESSEMVRRAVEAGGGIAFISRTAARESLEKQKVLAFTFPGVNTKRKMYMMYNKERNLSEAALNTISALRSFCSEKYHLKEA